MNKTVRWPLAGALALALTACGGGSDGPAAQTDDTPAAPASVYSSVAGLLDYLVTLLPSDNTEPVRLEPERPLAVNDQAEPEPLP